MYVSINSDLHAHGGFGEKRARLWIHTYGKTSSHFDNIRHPSPETDCSISLTIRYKRVFGQRKPPMSRIYFVRYDGFRIKEVRCLRDIRTGRDSSRWLCIGIRFVETRWQSARYRRVEIHRNRTGIFVRALYCFHAKIFHSHLVWKVNVIFSSFFKCSHRWRTAISKEARGKGGGLNTILKKITLL